MVVWSVMENSETEMWNHANCILRKANWIKSLEDVEGLELFRWEDQQKIRKYVESGVPSNVRASTVAEYGVEISLTSKAACKGCNQKIMKGVLVTGCQLNIDFQVCDYMKAPCKVRMSVKYDGQGAKGLAWHHANCFMELFPTIQVEKLIGWDILSASDQAFVLHLVKKVPSAAKGLDVEQQENLEALQQSASKSITKRKRVVSSDQKPKFAKDEGDAFRSNSASDENANELGGEHLKASNLDSQLEAQTKNLWTLKDDLRNHVSTAELREMLEANGQDSAGSEIDLRDRCADGMLFGALCICLLCSGCLYYSGGMYKCHGYLSAWSKCSYSATEPARVKGK